MLRRRFPLRYLDQPQKELPFVSLQTAQSGGTKEALFIVRNQFRHQLLRPFAAHGPERQCYVQPHQPAGVVGQSVELSQESIFNFLWNLSLSARRVGGTALRRGRLTLLSGESVPKPDGGCPDVFIVIVGCREGRF